MMDMIIKSTNQMVLMVTKIKRFSDYGDAGREITSILKNMYNGFWPTWSTVPNEEKDRLFDRFKMFFTWDPEIEVFIRDVWSKHNARRLCDSLSYARKIAIAKARSLGMEVVNDYTSIIPFNPTWIKQTFWRRLVEEHWNLEKWQSLSSSNSSNRAHLIEGLHTIGSAGYDICRRRFEADRGGPQPSADFFVYSHAKKGTRPGEGGEGSLSGPVFVDERARRTVENYKEYLIEKFAPEEPPRHDQECWERAVGKRKKGASYGSGKSKDPEYVLTGKLSGPLPSAFRGSQSEIQRLSQTVDELRQEHGQQTIQMQERYERQLQESLERHQREFREARERQSQETLEREERLKKEMQDQISELMKYLPNFQSPPT